MAKRPGTLLLLHRIDAEDAEIAQRTIEAFGVKGSILL